MISRRSVFIFLCAFIAGTLLTAFLRWPPAQSSDWAAWVQAVGSIGAIIGAYRLAASSETSRLKERQLDMAGQRYRSLALLVELTGAANRAIGEVFDRSPHAIAAHPVEVTLRGVDNASDALVDVLRDQVPADCIPTVVAVQQALSDTRFAISQTRSKSDFTNSGILSTKEESLAKSGTAVLHFSEKRDEAAREIERLWAKYPHR